MKMTENNNSLIYVYDHFSKEDPMLLGCLHVQRIRGGEVFSFEYDKEWLGNAQTFLIIDPELLPFEGRQFPANGRLFGVFQDSSPDRWGRTLMNRRERILAEKEDRKPVKLLESDYLLGVYDGTRMGGLRFKTDGSACFLSDDSDNPVPPWARLRTLEEASRIFESERPGSADMWLDQLIRPGSSLGGARPKATVADEKGQLWIAKFPSKHDENDSGAWEYVAHELADMCGLNVPEARLECFSEYGSTYMTKRFDREGPKRIHYASCMTLLGKNDGASASDGTGYLDIVDFIRANGARPKSDMEELWKRIVFSMAITNTDDHLRNHAFILGREGWELSPMFDVNPVPYGDELALNVSENDNRISIDLAISVAAKFGIEKQNADKAADEILTIVRENWRRIAKECGLSRGQIENMRPSFMSL